jgi:hypothetical protein
MLTMTSEIAWARATDAANEHMRNHGRIVWSNSDYNYAVSEYNYLMPDELAEKCDCAKCSGIPF